MDLLIEQAAIRRRYQSEQLRDAGKFVDPDTAADLHVARLARKQALKAELIARGLLSEPAPGCTKVKEHQRRLHVSAVPEANLFDGVAA